MIILTRYVSNHTVPLKIIPYQKVLYRPKWKSVISINCCSKTIIVNIKEHYLKWLKIDKN